MRIKQLRADKGSLALLEVYARKYFPGRPMTIDCLGEAWFLEQEYWRQLGKLLGAKEENIREIG